MIRDPFVDRWLDFAGPVVDAHAALNADPDRWAVLVTDRTELVQRYGCVGAMAVVLVVPRAAWTFSTGPVPPGTFPLLILAGGRSVALASGPLIPWGSRGAA